VSTDFLFFFKFAVSRWNFARVTLASSLFRDTSEGEKEGVVCRRHPPQRAVGVRSDHTGQRVLAADETSAGRDGSKPRGFSSDQESLEAARDEYQRKITEHICGSIISQI